MFIGEHIKEDMRLFTNNHKIININQDVFVMGLKITHPNIRISLTWKEVKDARHLNSDHANVRQMFLIRIKHGKLPKNDLIMFQTQDQ
jgi:hypothetical protein